MLEINSNSVWQANSGVAKVQQRIAREHPGAQESATGADGEPGGTGASFESADNGRANIFDCS